MEIGKDWKLSIERYGGVLANCKCLESIYRKMTLQQNFRPYLSLSPPIIFLCAPKTAEVLAIPIPSLETAGKKIVYYNNIYVHIIHTHVHNRFTNIYLYISVCV